MRPLRTGPDDVAHSSDVTPLHREHLAHSPVTGNHQIRAPITTAKMLVTLSWAVLLGAGEAALLMTAGLLLGLGAAGATGCFATLLLVSVVLSAGVLPVMWAATRWRGYLAGIGLTLAILVVTNLAAGFGLGTYTPWSIPVAWTMTHDDVSTLLLVVPVMTAAIGAWVTLRSWDRLQLGTD